MAELLPALVLWPLALGLLCFALPERQARLALWPGWLGQAALLAPLLGQAGGSPLHYALGGWPEPLGIALMADSLTLCLLALALVVYAAVLRFAQAYFERGGRQAAQFWPLAWLLWAALNASFLSADLFNLYVTLELLGLAAVGLVALSGQAGALAAALRYLLAALVGSNLVLLGVALLYGGTGVLGLAAMGQRLGLAPQAPLALALIAAALLLKTALVPLHFWLPPAHGGSATPVSALLSALVIKASLAMLLRLWLMAGPTLSLAHAGQLLAGLGGVAVLWGSWLALRQRRLKHLVAYSTVAQVGYLLLPLAWLTPTSPLAGAALEAGVLQLLAHGLAKAAMFLAAGCLLLAAGGDELEQLQGAVVRQPLAVLAFALAGASLIGLPPSAGFAAKWQLLRVAMDSGQWGWALLLIVGGLLAAAYVFKVLRLAFLPEPAGLQAIPLPRGLAAAALALALPAALGALGLAPLLARLRLDRLAWGGA